MARRRFFVENIHHGLAELTGEQAHHLTRVLRVVPGQTYEISDNRRVYLSRVEEARKERVVFRVGEELPENSPLISVSLLVSLIKFERLELIFEKATELGVERIAPVIAARSEKGLDRAAGKRMERWRRVVLEASQQSRRAKLPELAPPARFRDAIGADAPRKYRLEESAGAPALAGNLHGTSPAALLVGPEGGWTDAEREQAEEAGWTAVSLGPQILRTETAAIAAIALIVCGGPS
ncbi:MAG: 16S rRNA (uracil(1498)-N(3))-methyltransferase [Bryobacteraceae bacterium]|nr:16S rRNA (uracil(1498)-N(3))-methyltransferase [Bryobacteraceae bacterium]